MNPFETMIPNASETRRKTVNNESYKAEIKKLIENINRKIERAAEEGKTNTAIDMEFEYEEEIKKIYKDRGYVFFQYEDDPVVITYIAW